MAKDPENSKYQQCMARLRQAFQSRFSMTIIVAVAVVTVVAIVVFAKALSRRSPFTRPELATTQSVGQPSEQPKVQQSQTAATPPAKEMRPGDEIKSSPEPDSLRQLSELQQQLDQIKQAQELQIQTIASQLEIITRQQETSLQAASRMAAQILDLSQKATAVSTQHQESVRAIAALEAKIGNSQEAFSTAAPTAGNNLAATGASRLPNIHLAGVSTTTVSNGLQLNFDSGIFDRDDHLKIGSKPRLCAVAKALAQSQEQVVVYVVGLAYAEPQTWPWLEPRASSEVALLRACRVSTYLESLGIFPPGAILPRAGSAEDFPFPAGDNNNRTVLLRIFPR
jgi:hypothetical protein